MKYVHIITVQRTTKWTNFSLGLGTLKWFFLNCTLENGKISIWARGFFFIKILTTHCLRFFIDSTDSLTNFKIFFYFLFPFYLSIPSDITILWIFHLRSFECKKRSIPTNVLIWFYWFCMGRKAIFMQTYTTEKFENFIRISFFSNNFIWWTRA